MKVIGELIAYLGGRGLLNESDRVHLWRHGYYPDVEFDAPACGGDAAPEPDASWIEEYALRQRQQIVHERRTTLQSRSRTYRGRGARQVRRLGHRR